MLDIQWIASLRASLTMSAFESAGWLNRNCAIWWSSLDSSTLPRSVRTAPSQPRARTMAWVGHYRLWRGTKLGDRTQDFATITKDNAYLGYRSPREFIVAHERCARPTEWGHHDGPGRPARRMRRLRRVPRCASPRCAERRHPSGDLPVQGSSSHNESSAR